MSAAQNNLKRTIFRLSPLMLALTLVTPLQTQAADQAVTAGLNDETVKQTHQFHRDYVLGTSLDVVVTGVDKQKAKQALDAIETEIARLDKSLSVWRQDSEITALNQDKKIQASDDLFAVIAACEAWRDKTCGAFDARLGHLIGLWEQAQGVQQVDEATRVMITNQLQPNSVALDEQAKTIQIDAAVKFAPDAYAKGYVIDRAMLAAREAVPEIAGILVDIGGDLRVWGEAPNKSAWRVGVQDAFNHNDLAVPSQVLNLNDQAVAFSGQGYRDFAGQSHLLDPQSGMPLQHVEQCVVVGQCAADADALATALAAMSPKDGMDLIESVLGYEAQLTMTNGDIYQSAGWNNLLQQQPQADMKTVAAGSSAKWPAGYQAVIDLTIPKVVAEQYRAPYVSVWITDANKNLVRTLAVWGKHEKWINSNYVWWRRYGRQMTNLDAVAKPSRQPGNYKLAWDGKDDNGRSVAGGEYIVHIETSREHGGHSYQTMPLSVKAKASNHSLPAQTEIGSVKMNFQKVN
jgi:FAD:protein FMN transferase